MYPTKIVEIVKTNDLDELQQENYFLEDGTLNTTKAFERGCFFTGAQANWHKCLIISDLAASHHYTRFVETGTHLGDTLMTVSPLFEWNYSVEADPRLKNLLFQRFLKPIRTNVTIKLGESPEILPDIFEQVGDHKCVVFLDAL
mgnify:CR=1 FL=1